jgi:hypothetical protein
MPRFDDDIPLETEDEFRARVRAVESGGPQLTVENGRDERRDADQDDQPATQPRAMGGRAAMLLLVVVLALVALEVGATFAQHFAAAQQSDWQTAAKSLATFRKARQPILIAPRWAEPVAYQFLHGLVDIELASLSDVDRYETVWELSSRGRRHPWLKDLTPKRSWSFGTVTLNRYDKTPDNVLYDFRKQLFDAASVTVAPGSKTCKRIGSKPTGGKVTGGAFMCDRCNPTFNWRCWNWVGPHLAEVLHRPYACIYAHPVQGRRLRIDFKEAIVGSRIVGYTGIDDFDKRKKAKGTVRLQIFVDDKLVRTIVHQNHWPWTRFVAKTKLPSDTKGRKRHHVRFEITSEAGFERTFCFHAEARP